MKVAVAGLDLSLNSAGVAILPVDGDPVCWTMPYAMAKHPTQRDQMERVIWITNEIMGKLKAHGVRWVGIEDYAFSGHGLTRLAELTGNIKLQVYVGLRTVPVMIAANSVRKYHLGVDPKRKDDPKKKLRDYLSSLGYVQPRTFDESDALGVALVVNDWANRRDMIVNVDKLEVFERFDLHQSKSVHQNTNGKRKRGAA